MSKLRDALELWPIYLVVAVLLVLPAWWWGHSWVQCRKVGGVLVKDGCDMPACVEYKKAVQP